MARLKISYEEELTPIYLKDVALCLNPKDSVAVATKPISSGTIIRNAKTNTQFIVSHNVLEGHRFAIAPIAANQLILSWGYPFGRASSNIVPGEYLANEKMIDSLTKHGIDPKLLPKHSNFIDEINIYRLEQYNPVEQVPLDAEIRTFDGYLRPTNRGVGTRNYVLILGTSAASGPFVQCLEKSIQKKSFVHKTKRIKGTTDGIVCVVHTEGVRKNANNHAQTLRVLAGYVMHSNCGAVLLIDLGPDYEAIAMDELITECNLRLPGWSDTMPLRTHRLTGNVEEDLITCETFLLQDLLPPASLCIRTKQPLQELILAEQCGGSDAFSGVSANPIIGNVAERIIRQGGAAVLAESDELVGGMHSSFIVFFYYLLCNHSYQINTQTVYANLFKLFFLYYIFNVV